MGLLDKAKLKKLTVKAYKSRQRGTGDLIGVFEAMYNPEHFSQKYEIAYGQRQGLNSTNQQLRYTKSKPRELVLQLILDGTGVEQMGAVKVGKKPKKVPDQVKEFIDLTFKMDGSIHEPNFLLVEWGGKEDGGLIFSCRLASVDVAYSAFDRNGAPLRAELTVTLISDVDAKKQMAQENKNSPDLTHIRVVKSGDTLPLLTQEIYGSSAYYLRVAQFNELDNFRSLTPGQRLVFPPLEK